MTETGYATVQLTDDSRERHESHTAQLDCTATTVASYHLAAGENATLTAELEQVCIPILPFGDAPVDTEPTRELEIRLASESLSTRSVGRVPAGAETTIAVESRIETEANERTETADGVTVLVVAASADPGPESTPVVVDVDDCTFTEPVTSEIETARLTAPLGCDGVKINARRLTPGQHVPYHTEGDQEELFVPVSGPATMRVDDNEFETPVGTVTRVAPPVPRSAVNDGEREATWIMVGAPPTGGPSEWDPGAEMLE